MFIKQLVEMGKCNHILSFEIFIKVTSGWNLSL